MNFGTNTDVPQKLSENHFGVPLFPCSFVVCLRIHQNHQNEWRSPQPLLFFVLLSRSLFKANTLIRDDEHDVNFKRAKRPNFIIISSRVPLCTTAASKQLAWD